MPTDVPTNRSWLAITQQKRTWVLLGKRAPGCNNAGQWGLFGGRVDYEELNSTWSTAEAAQKAACRELKEETGLHVTPSKLTEVAVLCTVKRDFPVKTHFWQTAKSQLDMGALVTTNEVCDYEWVKIAEWRKFAARKDLHYSARMYFEFLENNI